MLQLGWDPDTVRPGAHCEQGFGTHLAKDILEAGNTYKPNFLTLQTSHLTTPRPRVCFVFQDSPPAPSVTTYLTNGCLHNIRTLLKSFRLPENTVVFTMHLKASSLTFPFVAFEEGSTIVRQILGKGDDT